MMIYEHLQKDDLSSADRLIADFFLTHKDELKDLSARDIGRILFVSASTVSRFAQKLGYAGYNDFKEAYLKECSYLNAHFTSIDANLPFAEHDSCYQIAGKISALYSETVADTYNLIDHEQLEKAAALLRKTSIIYIVSAGTYTELGSLFQEKMARISKNVISCPFPDISYYYSCADKKDAVFILISYSGETNSIIKNARKLHELKQSFIAITSYGSNSLSALADSVLYISTRERLRNNIGSFGPYISVMYLLDLLYSCVFRYGYKENLAGKYARALEFQDRRSSSNPILMDEEK